MNNFCAKGMPLTQREKQVFAYVGAGLLSKQIEARLGVCNHTVKAHLNALLTKLGVANRHALAVLWHGGDPAKALAAGDALGAAISRKGRAGRAPARPAAASAREIA